MKLLVIIVTYNAMRWAERCFDSLRKSTISPDVFVVDNGSIDGTQQFIQEQYPEAFFFQSEKNLGFGKANNLGLQYVLNMGYDYAYLLNQDAWVMPETFEKLVKLSRKYPEYGILSPFQMNEDMYHIDQNFIVHVLAWKSNHEIVTDIYNQNLLDIYPVPNVMAAHWFMTRECLQKVGGFSPSFSHYAEDDNYADRMHYKELKIGIVPSLRVVHDRGWREDSVEKKMYLAYTQCIRIISDPKNNSKKLYIRTIYNLIKGVKYYKSFDMLNYACKIILHIRTILNNKRISMKTECAFLDGTKGKQSISPYEYTGLLRDGTPD